VSAFGSGHDPRVLGLSPASGSGHDPRVLGLSPASGSLLSEPCSDSLLPLLVLSLSLSNK